MELRRQTCTCWEGPHVTGAIVLPALLRHAMPLHTWCVGLLMTLTQIETDSERLRCTTVSGFMQAVSLIIAAARTHFFDSSICLPRQLSFRLSSFSGLPEETTLLLSSPTFIILSFT